MSYIGNSPGVASQRVETAFTATSSQTVFTPSSGYTLGYCDVYQNGVKLVNGDDYTASDGATVTLTTGAASGDSIVIVASFPRGLSDGYLKSEADAKYLQVNGANYVTGRLGVGIATNSVGNLVVKTDSNAHGIWVVNDSTANYGEIYFGGSASAGYHGIRSDGRSTGWLRLVTGDTQRLNIDYTGVGTFYGSYWEYNASYPYLNNNSGGSVRPMLAFNTTGTYYAGLYDSGLASTSGSRQYFARASVAGGAPSSVLLAMDYQNNRVGIGTINPATDLQVSNPNGASSILTVKAVSSGSAYLNLDSYTTAGGLSTQISFSVQNSAKYAFGYANIGNADASSLAVYNYTTSANPWILTGNDYQRLPKTAAFLATINGNYNAASAGRVAFNTVSASGCFDNRSNFDTGNYVFFAPVDGWYQFNAVVNQYNVTTSYIEVGIRKNNGSVSYAGTRRVSGTTTGDQNVSASAVIYLAQGDYVDVYAYQAGGFSASVRWNTFSGHLIG